MYLQSLLEGFSEVETPANIQLRAELEALDLSALQEKLTLLDKKLFLSLNTSEQRNKRRLIRRIEKSLSYSTPKLQEKVVGLSDSFDVLKIGLHTDRKILYQRIDERVVKRVLSGMIEEAEHLHKNGLTFKRMRELGLEYRYLADFLEGRISTREEFISILQYKIHQFAKRQLTWFKKDEAIHWFDISTPRFKTQVEETILNWYNS